MADISKFKLPSGNTYNIKDAVAREAIAALQGGVYFLGLTTTAITDGATTNPISIDGKQITAINGNIVVYENGEFIFNGTKWIEFGDVSKLGTLATKDNVTLNKGTGDVVLGEATTFTAPAADVEFTGGSSDKVLGADTTFSVTQPTITPTKTTRYIKGTASGAAVGADGTAAVVKSYTPTTDTFVKSVSAETGKKLKTTSITPTNGTESVSKVTRTASKLATKSIKAVSNAGSASTFSFTMGSGDDAETLIISGANSVAPTLSDETVATGAVATNGAGADVVTAVTISDKTVAKAGTAVTVATGEADENGTGAALVTDVTIGASGSALTGLGTPTTENVLTGVKMTAQPTISLAADTSSGTGKVGVLTDVSAVASGAAVNANNDDEVTVVTNIGTAKTESKAVTVGTNDKVTVAKHGDLSISVQ